MAALSIVYSVRDPDYGGGLLHRMQVSLNTLAALAQECGLDYELIVVEWNPPADKTTIREAIHCPASARQRVRFFEVPRLVHEGFKCAPQLPFLEYVAKNTGIRRASGEWILASSPDVLFNRPLVQFLATAPLHPRAFYRIDRCDTEANIPSDACWRTALALAETGSFVTHRAQDSGLLCASMPAPRCNPQGQAAADLPESAPPLSPMPLHTNAAGDFFLMSRLNWVNLRGYTEICANTHIDSILCCTCASAGLWQVVLGDEMRLYHQHHDRSDHQKFPGISWSEWRARFEDAVARGARLIVNNEKWGLAGRTVLEYAPSA